LFSFFFKLVFNCLSDYFNKLHHSFYFNDIAIAELRDLFEQVAFRFIFQSGFDNLILIINYTFEHVIFFFQVFFDVFSIENFLELLICSLTADEFEQQILDDT